MEVISEKADINKTKRPMDKQCRVETREKKRRSKDLRKPEKVLIN